MSWYDSDLERDQTDRSANPSPGNKKGGLSDIVEKALGSDINASPHDDTRYASGCSGLLAFRLPYYIVYLCSSTALFLWLQVTSRMLLLLSA